MRFEFLAYCIEIARCQSLNKAAGILGVTQPALSSALNALEEELGFAVFQRSRRGMSLTPEGIVFVEDARTILKIQEGWQKLGHARQAPSVHVVANPVAYNSLLIPALHDLHALNIPLDVYPYEDKNRLIPSYLESGKASMGLMLVLPGDLPAMRNMAEARQWRMELLIEDSFRIFISADSPQALAQELRTEDLAGFSLALYPEDDQTTAMPLFSRYFEANRHIRLSNFEHLMDAVADGRAVGVFPEKLMRAIPQVASGAVRALPLRDVLMPVSYYLLSSPEDRLSTAEKRFIREIRSRIPED